VARRVIKRHNTLFFTTGNTTGYRTFICAEKAIKLEKIGPSGGSAIAS